ncbi:MAG: hypothetical protein AAB592_00985 [Patescibacteria group bacterium]
MNHMTRQGGVPPDGADAIPDRETLEALTVGVLLEASGLLNNTRLGVSGAPDIPENFKPHTFRNKNGAIMRFEEYADGTRLVLFVREEDFLSGTSHPAELWVFIDPRSPLQISDRVLPPEVMSRLGSNDFQAVCISNCETNNLNPVNENGGQTFGFHIAVKHRVEDEFFALDPRGLVGEDSSGFSTDAGPNLPDTSRARLGMLQAVSEKIADLKRTSTAMQSGGFRQSPFGPDAVAGAVHPALPSGDPADHDDVRAIDARTGRAIDVAIGTALAPVTGVRPPKKGSPDGR